MSKLQHQGKDDHQVGKDLPLPYGVITCRFVANWQREPAYGSGSPSACMCVSQGSVAFSICPPRAAISLPVFSPSLCVPCLYSSTAYFVNQLFFSLPDLILFPRLVGPYHFLPLASVVPLSFCSGLLHPVSPSSSWSSTDCTDTLNKHLSAINARLSQAKMTMGLFFLHAPYVHDMKHNQQFSPFYLFNGRNN